MEENIEVFVIDSSYILARLFPDESITNEVRTHFNRFSTGNIKFIAPELLKFEIINAFKTAILRKRISINKATQILKYFFKLKIKYSETDLIASLKIATEKNISGYDAVYLSLSKKHNCKLLTLDKKLASLQ